MFYPLGLCLARCGVEGSYGSIMGPSATLHRFRSTRGMESKDKIAIVLEEYKTLRAEVLQRTLMLSQIYAVAGTVGAGIIGAMVQYTAIASGTVMLGALGGLVTFATWLIDHEIRAVATRLQEIEAQVNALAGSRLLAWETDHGLQSPSENPKRVADVVQSIRTIVEGVGMQLRSVRKGTNKPTSPEPERCEL